MDENTTRSRHPDPLWQVFLWAFILTFLLLLNAPNSSYGQVVVTTDITATTSAPLDLGTHVDSVGTTTQITGGTRPGSGTNLFHSFDSFTLGTGDTAHFLNDMQRPTDNIFARVRGESSTIDGTLRTNFPGDPINPLNFGAAHLWLVNPAGLLLGPNARIEVGGSVSLTTANYLRFSDGTTSTIFDMLSTPASLGQLSVAPVVAFGFLGPELPAPITVQGSILQVPEGHSLSLVGGDITIQSGTLGDGTIQAASLRAPGGQLNLVSVASPGEVLFPGFQTGSFTTRGTVTIKESALLDVSGQFDLDGNLIGNGNSGTVFVRGGQLVMDASTIQAGTMGATDGAPTAVDIQVSQDVVLTNNSFISTFTSGPGGGGAVQLAADTLTMANDPFGIFTSTGGGGVGGDVVLHVREVNLMGASSIQSYNQNAEPGSGRGGNVTIQGLPGAEFGAAASVTLSGDSSLSSTTFGVGEGGQVAITAETLTMEGAFTTINASAQDVGLGGAIDVGVQDAHLNNGATITTLTVGATGSDTSAGGTITVHGLQGAISMAHSVTLSGSSSGIVSDTQGTGNSGAVAVYANLISLTDGALIQAGTPSTTGAGGAVTLIAALVDISGGSSIASQARESPAGQVTITADELTLDSGSIATNTSSSTGGKGGDVVLDVGTVSLSNGATINSSTASTEANAGDAGNVNITFSTTGNTVSLASGSSITSSTTGAGEAGQVIVTMPTLSLNDATITTSTSGTGNAGGITANVGTLSLTNKAEISSNSTATASGNAGTVTIQGQGGPDTSATSVALTNSSLLTNTEGTGAGGEIQIRAGQVQLSDLAKLTAETFGTGKAGSIKVTSDNLNITGGARFEASTAGVGNAGDITITNSDTVSVTGLSSNDSTRSGIFAKTQSSGGITGGGSDGVSGGDAGNIGLTTNNLLLSGGAQIDSSTTTSGSGGSVSVTANAITITGTSTSLRSDASRGNGTGGDIELVARTIGIHDKASVTAATDGSGDAGNISMKANESFTLDSAAVITTSTRGSGSGGTILINSPQVLVDGLDTSITASTLRPFADLAVTLSIVHPNDGDLTVRLDSPDGTRVALLSRVPDSGQNFTGTIFDDRATQPITSGSAPYTGTFIPREPLAQLIDQTVAGTWKLNVNDQVAGNTASSQSLQSWSLRVGDQVFQSTNIPRPIPGNGPVSSSLVVTGPAGAVVQGLGEVSGVGGDVTINAGTVTVQNGATLSATTRGSGQGGTVTVNATGQVALAGPGTGLFTNSEASGRSGDINVTASHMTMDNGAKVSAASSETGDAGQVIVTTPTLNVDNATISTSTSSTGNAGSITANVGTLTLTNVAEISSSSTGTMSDAGDAGSVTIQGLASPADTVTITNSSLLTKAEGSGQGGDIRVDAKTLTLNNATLSVSVKDFNAADASDGAAVGTSNVALTVPTLTMTGGTISAETSGTRNGGTLTVRAENSTFQNGAAITSASIDAATGAAGSVTFQGLGSPAQTLTLTDTSVLTSTKGPGQGGLITMEASNINLTNSTIATSSTGSGNAGDISINSKEVPGDTFEMWHSTMSTSAALADGGNIGIYATNIVRLTDSSITSSVGNETKTDTLGGNIKIDPQFVILQNSQIRANAFAGSGGNIRIVSSVFLADPFSQQNISASSQRGISGTVNIQSPLQNVGAELTALTQEFSSAAALLAQQCAARAADGKFSTFVVAAREGLPAEPGGFLASPSLTGELLGSRLSGRDPQTQLLAVTGLFPKYDARPIQLAKLGSACR